MEQLMTFAEEYPVRHATWVLAYAALGDREQAMSYLQQLNEQPVIDTQFSYVKTNAFRIPVLEEPEFVELRNQMQYAE